MPDNSKSGDGQAQAYKPNDLTVRRDSISNNAIVISAILCLGGLTGVITTTLIISEVFYEPPENTESASLTKNIAAEVVATEFKEGYSMILPLGFIGKTRRETEGGDVVYSFNGEDGCELTLALINDETLGRFSSPPKTYADSLIPRIPELSTGIDGEVPAERLSVNGMPSVLFRFYEKETFRGVIFTHYMVSMDRGRKIALKIAGKYGNFSDEDSNLNMPAQWYDAMLTLKRTGPAR